VKVHFTLLLRKYFIRVPGTYMDNEEQEDEEFDLQEEWEITSGYTPPVQPTRVSQQYRGPRCELCNGSDWFCKIISEHKICVYYTYHAVSCVRNNVDLAQMEGAYLCEECCKKHLDFEKILAYPCPLCLIKYAAWFDGPQGHEIATFYEGNGVFHSGDGSAFDGDIYQANFDCKDITIGQTICDKCVARLVPEGSLVLTGRQR
jgi:hypothetical protein